jgi:ABC-type branched-chain amino acid transport systems, ATPase component
MILDVQQIHGFYGKSHILQGVSLQINDGETVTLWAVTARVSRPRSRPLPVSSHRSAVR